MVSAFLYTFCGAAALCAVSDNIYSSTNILSKNASQNVYILGCIFWEAFRSRLIFVIGHTNMYTKVGVSIIYPSKVKKQS